MSIFKKIICIILVLFACSNFYVSAEEPGPAAVQKTGGQIEVFDFKETPISDVFKVFTDLTGKNVVASKEIMGLKVTLFLKGVGPQEALKTMCKLYNLWFTEEDNVIRIMTAEEYGKELIIRRDEKTVVHRLKYASCLAVADLLKNLFGNCIEYVEPGEIESYGHVGTEKETSSSSSRGRASGYSARTKRDAYISSTTVDIKEDLSSKVIEKVESKSGKDWIEAEDILEAKSEQAVVYLAVFPRNNSIVCRSVDARILNDIGDFIKKIDTPTSQVLLEGKILEVTLTDDFKSFFDFEIKSDSGKHTADIGNFASLDTATLIYQFVDKNVDVRMEMFKENNQLKVVGTPMILCANNAPGEFFIGEERPITVNYEYEIREYEKRSTETMRPVIELKDIGTKLSITPSINEDKTVTMRFLAEVDNVKAGGASVSFVNQEGKIVTLPIDTVDSSRVENIIMASDGSTLAIGGLIREIAQDYERKVPLFGDIPLLGFFFKKKDIKKAKTETVFLITPHIMMAPEEAEAVSDEVISALSDHPYGKDAGEKLLYYDEKNKTLKSPDKKNKQEQEKAPEQSKAGEVLSVDSQNGFVIIGLGKNDGIKIGDIFSVCRQDKLIGTVTVINLRPSVSSAAAVGQTRMEEIKQGDKIKELAQ